MCLPSTGGPSFLLIALGVLLVAVGVRLAWSRGRRRAVTVLAVVAAFAAVAVLSPADRAFALDGCGSPSSTVDDPADPADTGDPDDGEGGTDPVAVFTVAYAAGPNGTILGSTSQRVESGDDAAAVTAVPDTGYRFAGWSDGSTDNPRTDTDVTGDLSVTAEFALRSYEVTYSAGTGGTIDGDPSQQVDHGDDASTVTAVPDTGYDFVQWSDGSTTNPRTDQSVVADLDVTAEFAVRTYTLTYTAGPGGTIDGDASQEVDHGDDGSTVTAVPDEGQEFVRWSDDSTQNPRTDTDVTSDLSLSAVFESTTYAVTYSAGTGGSIEGESTQFVDHGSDSSAVTAVPDTGYQFVQWSDGRTENPRSDADVTGDLSVTAEFGIRTYTVTYTAGDGGTLGGTSPQTVDHGSDTTEVTAVPDTGYRFVQWSDGRTENPRSDADVTGDLSVTAEFVLTHTVTYTAGTGGTIDGTSPQTVDDGGDTAEVTAVAGTGYRFVQWSDGSTENPRSDADVTADVSVTAEFSPAVDLALRGVRRASIGAGGPSTLDVVNSGAETAEYLMVPTNTTGQAKSLTTSITGNAAPPVTGTASGPAPVDDAPVVRRRAAVALAEQTRGTTAQAAPLQPAARVPSTVPQVGDTFSVNRDPQSCTTGTVATARVAAVGTHVIVATDVDNPDGGLTTSQYTDLATFVDEQAYPAVTAAMGAPSDIDGNDRIVLFATRGVNELSPTGTPAAEIVLSRPRDLLPQSECATSNVGEVFYMLAADPTGAVNGNVRTAAFVESALRTGFAPALGYHLMDARRLEADAPLDATWLADAVADAASERVFYAASVGLTPLTNIALATLTTGTNASRRVAAFNLYANPMYGRYRPWMQLPSGSGPLGAGTSASQRGAGWAFLRYAADRAAAGSLTAESQFFRTIVDGELAGRAQLAAALPGSVDEWLVDFAASAYLDDDTQAQSLGTGGPFSAASWNYRSIFGGLGGFPLQSRGLAVDGSDERTFAAGGGSAYLRFSVAAGEAARLTLTPATWANGSTMEYTLVRLK